MDKVKEYLGFFKSFLKTINDYMAAYVITALLAAIVYISSAYYQEIESHKKDNKELSDLILAEFKAHTITESQLNLKLAMRDKSIDSLSIENNYLKK